MSDYLPLDVERELRRLGADLRRLGGLATGGGLTGTDLLRWLRTLPGGIGHDEVLRRLAADPAAGGPHAPRPEEPEAPDVAGYRDPEVDTLRAANVPASAVWR